MILISNESNDKATSSIRDFTFRKTLHNIDNITNIDSLKEYESNITEIFDSLVEIFYKLKKNSKHIVRFYGLEHDMKTVFLQNQNFSKEVTFSELLGHLRVFVLSRFQRAYEYIEKRPIHEFDSMLGAYFSENLDPRSFEVEELGALVTNRANQKLSNFLTLNKVAYIDTPMVVGVDNIHNSSVPHWVDLDKLLRKKITVIHKNQFSRISQVVLEEIIQGKVEFDHKNESFLYKRNDGLTLELFSCATGLKSFGVLQILYENGWLDSKTFLILDEPEAHLHPEWVVQYARLIVVLHKELGVNFLIGSHNPDFVMAIKSISQKKIKNHDKILNFYLAKKNGDYTYDFISA